MTNIIVLYVYTYVVIQRIKEIKDDPDLKKVVLETLAPDPAPSSASPSSVAPSSLGAPSDKAMKMTSEELCQWLKEKKIADKYIECFREDDVDGSELATYNDDDLEHLGISEPRIRKKIMVKFRAIS